MSGRTPDNGGGAKAMGGKPSKGTPADRRLKTNKPAPVKQPAKTAARPVKPMPRRGR